MNTCTETRQICGSDGSTIVFFIRKYDLNRDWHAVTKWLLKNIEQDKYRAGYMTSGQKSKFDIDTNTQAFFVQLASSEDAVLMRLSV